MVKEHRIKIAATLPISFFLEDVDYEPEDFEDGVPQDLFEEIHDYWENLSDEEKLEHIEGITGHAVVENLAFVDRYEANSGEHDQVLYE